MAEELLAKAMEGRYDPPETILAKGGRARSVVPRGEDPVENPTSSDPDPTESFIIPKPTIPDSPPAQVASLPDIPGPSKSALPPPHREAEVPAEKSPSSSSPPSPGVARSPFSKKLASGPTVLPPWKPVFNRSPRRNRPGPLPSASRQFQMPRTVKREPTFKEPMLPERILTGEFNRLVFRPRMSTSPIEVPPEFQPKSPRDSSPIEAPRDVKDVEDMALA
ncbi:hypothetical protein BDW22DRAFT_1014754 [Trametopsis cervina]|nr:hypothetical protein BDW22DRAFT_1014754 [Trametopsis cervina]